MLKFSKTERKDSWSTVASMEYAMTYEETPYKTTVYRQNSSSTTGKYSPTHSEYKDAIVKSMSNRNNRRHMIPELHPETENIVITHNIKLRKKKLSKGLKDVQPNIDKADKNIARKVKSLSFIETTTLDVKYGDLKWKKPEYKIDETKGLSSLDIEENYCTPSPRKKIQISPTVHAYTSKTSERRHSKDSIKRSSRDIVSSASSNETEKNSRLNSATSSEITSEETNSISSNSSTKSKESAIFRFHQMRKHVKRIVSRERKKSKLTEELQSVSLPNFSSDEEDEMISPYLQKTLVTNGNGDKTGFIDGENTTIRSKNLTTIDDLTNSRQVMRKGSNEDKNQITIEKLNILNNNNIVMNGMTDNRFVNNKHSHDSYDALSEKRHEIQDFRYVADEFHNDTDSPVSSIKTKQSSSVSLICSDRSFSDASDIINEENTRKRKNERKEYMRRNIFQNDQRDHLEYRYQQRPRSVAFENYYPPKNDIKTNSTINLYLKSDILVKVFSYLTTFDLCQVSKVCKRWYQLYLSPELWKTISLKNYNENVDSVLNVLLQRLAFSSPYACLNVKFIQLDCCTRLTDQSLSLIAMRCPELKSIELPGSVEISGKGISTILANCPNLAYINLSGCDNLSNFNFSENSGMKFGQNASFLELRYIDFSECTSLQDFSLKSIVKCSSFLEYLYIRRCDNISNVGIEAVAENCQNLKEISLNECYNVSDIGVVKLLQHCTTLRYLSLAKCTITDTSVKAIAKFSKSLRHLNLHECEAITDAGIIDIANVCDRLRSIDLGKCMNITNSSIFAISQCKHLRRLCLKGCLNITDSGIRKVATHCKNLRHIDLRQCQFSYETLSYTKQRCQDCSIQHSMSNIV